MSTVMTAASLVEKAVDIAKNYKTLYVMGCFGAPMTDSNKTRYINNGASNSYNAQAARKAMINAASADTFGFDCVCLIKGILWGWSGDSSKTYGGATYASNGVPDVSADGMIALCTSVSTSGWTSMAPGEAVWMSGHIGIYIGDGLAVECTPSWENKVQITAVGNIGSKSGYNTRTWTKHGKIPYIDYTQTATTQEEDTMTGEQIVQALTSENCLTILRQARAPLQDNDASSYSKEARQWAKDNGIIQGSSATEFNGMWEDLLTREQIVVILYRFAQLLGKA